MYIGCSLFSSLLTENEQTPASVPFHKSSISHLYLVSSSHTAQWKAKWYPWGCFWLISSCLTFVAHKPIKLRGLLWRACSVMCNTNKCVVNAHTHTRTHKPSGFFFLEGSAYFAKWESAKTGNPVSGRKLLDVWRWQKSLYTLLVALTGTRKIASN